MSLSALALGEAQQPSHRHQKLPCVCGVGEEIRSATVALVPATAAWDATAVAATALLLLLLPALPRATCEMPCGLAVGQPSSSPRTSPPPPWAAVPFTTTTSSDVRRCTDAADQRRCCPNGCCIAAAAGVSSLCDLGRLVFFGLLRLGTAAGNLLADCLPQGGLQMRVKVYLRDPLPAHLAALVAACVRRRRRRALQARQEGRELGRELG
eukprot:CAMPEP_0115570816 /NCGR_PEP_ID=MMETSP0271-20121206/105895_1 /TAXON_ID=71861 /ORGANISM="Scrippsiella trochoidea, Strain CCMP3099" /LENGTH=209 /DNA_ID=CAMNT_0003005367 /DNA_START=82 /DNA_END=708 /DNA_ORIENTATION=-